MNDFNNIRNFLDESYKESFSGKKLNSNKSLSYKESEIIKESIEGYYGIPELKKYPMNDKEHVILAIKFFNYYADTEYANSLANRINDRIQYYKIKDNEVHMTDRNKFRSYYKPYNEDSNNLDEFVRYDNTLTYNSPNKYITADDYSDEEEPESITFEYDNSPLGFFNSEEIRVESLDSSITKKHPIFMVMSFTYSAFGKIIKLYTGDKYSHTSLSFDSSLHKMYSFDANAEGFVIEDIKNYTRFSKDSYMIIKAFYVSDNSFKLIKDYVMNLKKNKEKTSYSFKHVFDILFNKKDNNANQFSQICSEFTASIFKIIGKELFNKANNLITPQDIADLKDPKIVDFYNGKIVDYKNNKARNLFRKQNLGILDESKVRSTMSLNKYATASKPKVYFSKVIDPEFILKVYKTIFNNNDYRNLAVKVHSGEVGNQNFIQPEFWKPLIDYTKGTIVECNTAYSGERNTTEKHMRTIHKHGWDEYFDVDIMDSEKPDMELKVNKGRILDTNLVGNHLKNYDAMLVLSHFKGHPMGGFGGALKNISIGVASADGKRKIHRAPEGTDIAGFKDYDQNEFIEAMAEAAGTIIDYFEGKMVFINVMKNMSVDCDCCKDAEDPCMKDIGFLISTDPVALDKACLDLVYNSDDMGKEHLIERIESRNGNHIIEYAKEIGIGFDEYELVNLDESELFNESLSFGIEATSLYARMGLKTPEDILMYMRGNIKYANFTKLQKPEITVRFHRGACHDQTMLVSYLLTGMKIKHGRVFCMEYNEGENAGGNTHSFNYYLQNNKYYWIETAWEGQEGIHGPYKNLKEIQKDVTKKMLSESDYKKVMFGNMNKVQYNMNLQQLIEACLN